MKTGSRILGILMILLAVLLSSCENDLLEQAQTAREAAVQPSLTTAAVTNKGTTTATAGGEVIDDGGLPLIARGICWSISPNPTIGGSHLENAGVAQGSYSDLMTGLAPGTLYYVRAYASNSVATGYGNQESFVTMPSVPPVPIITPVGYPSGSGQAVVTWTNENGSSTYYDLYCSSTSTMPGTPDYTSINSESYTVSGLIDYATYYFWVVAKNATGTSSASASGTGGAGVPVTSVTLDRVPQVFFPGYVEALTVTVLPEDATNPNLIWGSSASAVLALSNTSNTGGLVAGGTSAGSATILIATADNQGAYASFTAEYKAASVGAIGPAGGFVIYDKGDYSDGWRYLEVGSEDIGSYHAWRGSQVLDISGAYNNAYGGGKANTEAIIAAQGEGTYMAMDCINYRKNGYADWYMPCITEATQVLTVLGGASYYSNLIWFVSSNQYYTGACWAFYCQTTPQWQGMYTANSNYATRTRPVRRF